MANSSLNINFRAYESIVDIYENIYRDSYHDLEFDLAFKVKVTKWPIARLISTFELRNQWWTNTKTYTGILIVTLSLSFDLTDKVKDTKWAISRSISTLELDIYHNII